MYEYESDYACGGDDHYGFDCKDPDSACFGEERTLTYDDDYTTDDDTTEDDATATDDATTTTTADDTTTTDDDTATDDATTTDDTTTTETDADDDESEPEEVLPTVDGAVEVGTKTEVGVTATAYDVRPGASSGMVGCGEEGGDGCAPANSRDGIVSEVESRWSCSSKLVEGGGPCQIEYTFAEPQDIVDIQAAFWKGDERIRKLEVSERLKRGSFHSALKPFSSSDGSL